MGQVVGLEGHNSDSASIDQPAVMAVIEQIEVEQAKIDDVNASAKETNAAQRDEMAKLKKQLRDDHGLEAKAIATILTKRRQERRMKDRIAGLPEKAKDQFEMFDAA